MYQFSEHFHFILVRKLNQLSILMSVYHCRWFVWLLCDLILPLSFSFKYSQPHLILFLSFFTTYAERNKHKYVWFR